MGFSGRTRTVGSSYVGRQGTSDRYTDGQVWGSPHTGAKIAFDFGIVEPKLEQPLCEKRMQPVISQRERCDKG